MTLSLKQRIFILRLSENHMFYHKDKAQSHLPTRRHKSPPPRADAASFHLISFRPPRQVLVETLPRWTSYFVRQITDKKQFLLAMFLRQGRIGALLQTSQGAPPLDSLTAREFRSLRRATQGSALRNREGHRPSTHHPNYCKASSK